MIFYCTNFVHSHMYTQHFSDLHRHMIHIYIHTKIWYFGIWMYNDIHVYVCMCVHVLHMCIEMVELTWNILFDLMRTTAAPRSPWSSPSLDFSTQLAKWLGWFEGTPFIIIYPFYETSIWILWRFHYAQLVAITSSRIIHWWKYLASILPIWNSSEIRLTMFDDPNTSKHFLASGWDNAPNNYRNISTTRSQLPSASAPHRAAFGWLAFPCHIAKSPSNMGGLWWSYDGLGV